MSLRASGLLGVLPGLFAAIALPATAGDVQPTAQNRAVSAMSTSVGDLWQEGSAPVFPDFDPPTTTLTAADGDSQAAGDFQPFSATSTSDAPGVLVVPTAGGATAGQDSTIAASGFTASGSFSMSTDAYVVEQSIIDLANLYLTPPVPYWLGFAHDNSQAASHYAVTFDVTADTPYALTASLSMDAGEIIGQFFPDTAGNMHVRLTGPGGVVHEAAWDQVADGCDLYFGSGCIPGSLQIHENGVLTPGSYTLEAHVEGSAAGNCGDLPDAPDCWLPGNGGSFDVDLALGAGGLDHYMFYKVRGTRGTADRHYRFGPVTLVDQFGSGDYDVIRVQRLGLPAEKNAEVVTDTATHLVEYSLKPRASGFTPQAGVQIVNQCNDLTLAVLKPVSLLVPAAVDATDPPEPPDPGLHNVDHFLCYKVKASALPKGMQVAVRDDFQTRRYDLKKITKLCNPVAKDQNPLESPTVLAGPDQGMVKSIEPASIRNPDDHLVCYRARLARRMIAQDGCGAIDPGDRGVTIVPAQARHTRAEGLHTRDQFGPLELDSVKELELCIPSQKIVP